MPRLTLSRAASSVVALYVIYRIVYYIYWQLTTGATRRKLIKERGCKPPRRSLTKDPFFGIDIFYDSAINIRKHTALQWRYERLQKLGANTTRFPLLFRWHIITIEPKVVQTILSLDFNSFGLGAALRQNLQLKHGRFPVGNRRRHERNK